MSIRKPASIYDEMAQSMVVAIKHEYPGQSYQVSQDSTFLRSVYISYLGNELCTINFCNDAVIVVEQKEGSDPKYFQYDDPQLFASIIDLASSIMEWNNYHL